MRSLLSRWFILVIALAFTAAACNAGGGDDAATGTTIASDSGLEGVFVGAATTTMPASPDEDVVGAGRDLGDGGVAPVIAQPVDLGRDIIFTAELTVAVADVATAGQQATQVIQGLGGLVFGQRTTGSPPQTVLVFKVFPEDFQTALDLLGGIGDLRTQIVSASDVTDRVVDLQSRINTAAASVERLRSFLAGAIDIATIVELENELLARESQLETLRGQLRTLQDQVALATITLTITEAAVRPALAVEVTAYPGHDGAGTSCPGNGGITVDEGGPFTMCFEITNVGDTLLTDLQMRDPILDLSFDDVILVVGDPAAALEPGQSLLVAFQGRADRDIRTQTTVIAQPATLDGIPLPGREAAATVTMFVDSVDPGGIPTFGEGLESSWNALTGLGRFLMLAVGVLIPFLWVPVILWLLWRWERRSNRSSDEAAAAARGEKEPVGAGIER